LKKKFISFFFKIKFKLRNEKKLSTLYQKLEKPLLMVLAYMEKNGILLDLSKANQLSQEFALLIDSLTKEIYNLAGCEFNIASPKQLSEILFNKMQINIKYTLTRPFMNILAALDQRIINFTHKDSFAPTRNVHFQKGASYLISLNSTTTTQAHASSGLLSGSPEG
jgi:hypothetical protein